MTRSQIVGSSTRQRTSKVPTRESTTPWRELATLSGIAHFLLASALFVALAYVFGGSAVLVGPVGNDSPLHIANTEWFDRYLPDIPNWYPLHGGGMSIQRSYPITAYLLVAGLSRLSGLSIVQAYRLIGFLSVPLTAVALYIFSRGALRNKTVGLIAGVLFILSPVAWSWFFEQGYIATTVSAVTLPIVMLAFIRFIASVQEKPTGLSSRLWFVLFVLALGFTTITHAVVAASAIVGIGLYFAFQLLTGEYGWKFRSSLRAAKAALIAGAASAALVAFWVVPVLTYGQVANREGLNTYSPSSIPRPSLAELFSFKSLDSLEWGWFRNSSIPIVIGVLFIIGALLSARYSRRALALSLTGVAAIVYLLAPGIAIGLLQFWPMWPLVFRTRSFVVLASVIFPLVAAFGCWALARTLLNPLGLFRRGKTRAGSDGFKLGQVLKRFLESALALVAVAAFVYLFRNASSEGADRINYGLTRSGFNAADIWGSGTETLSILDQLAPENWPAPELADDDGSLKQSRDLAALLPETEFLRIDISPSKGRIAQSLPLYANASQMNTYIFNGNLNHGMWGYQVNVFFNQDPPESEYGTPMVLDQAAKWLGTEFVFLQPGQDPTMIYEAAGWETLVQGDGFELWKHPKKLDYVTLSTRPLVLVISQEDIRGFEQVFRAANRGAMLYEEVWVIQGRDRVDSYSAKELQQFDAVFLHGYTYRNSVKAWAILEQYVSRGGSLYVDTGWQWTVPEWEFLHTPRVLPISTLKWTNYGMSSEYDLSTSEIGAELDIGRFSPLTWENGPWAVSGARPQDVRDWGKVVLSAAGQPLVVAGEYGQGRVIWSGMNLIAHANDKQNEEEYRLLRDLVTWLTTGKEVVEFEVDVSRDHPDRVEFNFELPSGEKSALLWRESFYPAWHAYIETENSVRQELPIYRGGPGFMLMPIEGISGKAFVELVWETPLVERISTAFSIVTLLFLSAMFIDTTLLRGKWITRLLASINAPRKKSVVQGSVSWLPGLENASGASTERSTPAPNQPVEAVTPASSPDDGASDIFDLGSDVGRAESVEALWEQLAESGALPSANDQDAERMIARWRRARDGDETE